MTANTTDLESLKAARAAVARDWFVERARIESLPMPDNVGELVDTAADTFGDALAWDFFEIGERWTFAEIRDEVNRAANALLALGVTSGDRVAVMLPNRGLYLITWLGLARIGAAIVPVNGRYTAPEILHVLRTTEPVAVIVEDTLRAPIDAIDHADLPPQVRSVVSAGADTPAPDSWDFLVAAQDAVPPAIVAPEHDALLSVQFTSGTTGFPKGCMLSHRYWLNVAVAWNGYVTVPVERFLVNQMLFYIDGQFNALFCLRRGATLYVSSRPSASKFSEWLKTYRINGVFYFDPLFQVERRSDDAYNDLRIAHIFGFRPALHRDLEERYGVMARESFGMTEYAPSLVMPMDSDVMVGSGSCGLPAPHTEVRLVDDEGREVASGEVGELICRSPAQMLGYFGDEEATAAALAGGWLHTGDLFRQDDAGFFYIVGRKKDMVRRNSENVACREVEAVLRSMPQIKEAAVVGVPDEVMGEEIKAYVQLQTPGESLEPREVFAYCADHLASFKVPRYLTFHEEFKITESARVEKKLLIAGVADLRVGSYDRVEGQWL